MKFNSRSIIIFVAYFLSIFQISNVGATEKKYAQVYNEIITNKNLVNSLNKNKLSPQEAAKNFLSAAEKIQAQTGYVNWDGLALCFYVGIRGVLGGEVMVCHTTKKSYGLGIAAAGGFDASMGAVFLYISFKNPNQKKWCFKGAEFSFGEGPVGGIGAGGEAKCRFDGNIYDFDHFLGAGDYIENGGRLYFIRFGIGAAINLSYDSIYVLES
ncbi:MAG: hypothetical protein QE271_08870 [Bacteriovoracaceae bacterium]|nr:hypothetical protein [Bacteriovoracaceae bacterium]